MLPLVASSSLICSSYGEAMQYDIIARSCSAVFAVLEQLHYHSPEGEAIHPKTFHSLLRLRKDITAYLVDLLHQKQ